VAALVGVAGSQGDRPRLVLARGPVVLESGALLVRASIGVDGTSALVAVVFSALVLAGALGAARRSAGDHWGTVNGLVTAVLAVIVLDDLLLAVAAWEGAALAGWRLSGPAGRRLPIFRLGSVAVLCAGALVFWSVGATTRSPEGRLVRDISLARLVGEQAAYEIAARRPVAAPVGVEEAMARGDRTASTASWVLAGPTFSTWQLRELVRVTSTGIGTRLAQQHLFGVPIRAAAAGDWHGVTIVASDDVEQRCDVLFHRSTPKTPRT
jgi:hypothetical protein